MLAGAFQNDNFLLGQQLVTAIGGHFVEFLEALHRLLHGNPIGQQAAEPAVVDVEHVAARRLFRDGVLRLALGADEHNRLALRGQFLHEFRRFLEHLQRLLEINDVNAVAFSKDVFLHLGIPALGLMPEVNTCFEQFLHRNIRQINLLMLICIRSA